MESVTSRKMERKLNFDEKEERNIREIESMKLNRGMFEKKTKKIDEILRRTIGRDREDLTTISFGERRGFPSITKPNLREKKSRSNWPRYCTQSRMWITEEGPSSSSSGFREKTDRRSVCVVRPGNNVHFSLQLFRANKLSFCPGNE